MSQNQTESPGVITPPGTSGSSSSLTMEDILGIFQEEMQLDVGPQESILTIVTAGYAHHMHDDSAANLARHYLKALAQKILDGRGSEGLMSPSVSKTDYSPEAVSAAFHRGLSRAVTRLGGMIRTPGPLQQDPDALGAAEAALARQRSTPEETHQEWASRLAPDLSASATAEDQQTQETRMPQIHRVKGPQWHDLAWCRREFPELQWTVSGDPSRPVFWNPTYGYLDPKAHLLYTHKEETVQSQKVSTPPAVVIPQLDPAGPWPETREAIADRLRRALPDLTEDDALAAAENMYPDSLRQPTGAPATTVEVPDDVLARLRRLGWYVGVHNDYRLAGEARTFWLLTHPSGRWVKGEGTTDLAALREAEAGIAQPVGVTEATDVRRIAIECHGGKDILESLYLAAGWLPICPLLSVVTGAIQEIQYLRQEQ